MLQLRHRFGDASKTTLPRLQTASPASNIKGTASKITDAASEVPLQRADFRDAASESLL